MLSTNRQQSGHWAGALLAPNTQRVVLSTPGVFEGVLCVLNRPLKKSRLMSCSINHPLLVTVIQALPQCYYSAGLVVAETERGLLP